MAENPILLWWFRVEEFKEWHGGFPSRAVARAKADEFRVAGYTVTVWRDRKPEAVSNG